MPPTHTHIFDAATMRWNLNLSWKKKNDKSRAVALSADWPVCCQGQRSTRHRSRESERAEHQLAHVSLIISLVYKILFIYVFLFFFLISMTTILTAFPLISLYSLNHLICPCLPCCLYVGADDVDVKHFRFLNKLHGMAPHHRLPCLSLSTLRSSTVPTGLSRFDASPWDFNWKALVLEASFMSPGLYFYYSFLRNQAERNRDAPWNRSPPGGV